MADENRNDQPRRSLRLALTEVSFNETISPETPGKHIIISNPDEMIILMRGPRRRPIIWSPVEDTNAPQNVEAGSYKTPERPARRKPDVNPKLRRRLLMSPTKNSSYLGDYIAKKLRALPARQPKLE